MVGVVMAKLKPLHPPKAKISWQDSFKLGIMALIELILWVVMVIASIHVLFFWAYTLSKSGLSDSTTIQYSVLVAVGAYFCLIVDKDKILNALKTALKIKTEPPYYIKKYGKNGRTTKVN